MLVGAAIFRERYRRGLTQQALAARALVTPANLCAIEHGRRDLTVGTLVRIARGLGVPPAHLLRKDDGHLRSPGRQGGDAAARAAITGKRTLSPRLNRLADGLAWICKPSIQAGGGQGVRRASRKAWIEAQQEWDHTVLQHLQARVRRFSTSPTLVAHAT
ncbi:MAG TPA: helix-turn-helix transcriptional regulator [Candidatus Dormibacteraeota bacterium]|nr:helix-turn-helix transcriptional regulator [Candidatus Dormibacteraeota bacterium]